LASAEIKIPGLVPGKRYRMVIETANSAGNITVGTTSVPSIEFVVPSANQLLSTYVPNYSTSVTSYPDVQGPQNNVGVIVPSKTPTIPGKYKEPPTNVSKSKACDNTVLTYGSGFTKYLFRFASTAGAPPVGTDFRASGMSSGGSDYYDNLIYTRTADDPGGGNIVATARLQSSNYDFPNQTNAQDKIWRTRGGQHWGAADLKSTAGSSKPTLRWTESYREWIEPSGGQDNSYPAAPTYDIIPGYSIITVTVSLPASINLENNISRDGKRVVELPVFFYIENGIFKDMNNNVMSGLPPAITGVPSAIPRTATNVNPKEVNSSQITLRSYRFTTAKYTLDNGLWSAQWSQFDDRYVSEPLMRNVIYSGQAIL
jgi:hypothetical protein